MRRSALAVIGIAAVLAIAACSPDQPRREPLAPTDPSLAPGGGGGSQLCAGGLLSDIVKQEKALFTTTQIAFLDPLRTAMKNACPTQLPSATLLTYVKKVIEFRGTYSVARAQALVKLWEDVAIYATSYATPLDRSHTVFDPGVLPNPPGDPNGLRGGGAAVLDGDNSDGLYDLEMFTWDKQAGFQITAGQQPDGPHLITLTPAPCPGTSLVNLGGCYEVESYPKVTTWVPNFDFGQCVRGGSAGIDENASTTAISHLNTNFGTEVLPPGSAFPWVPSNEVPHPSCSLTHLAINSWLGREAGPLGRLVARGIDYLRPQPLFADDAGESGQAPSESPFGGVLQVIFEDDFDEINNPPDIGDAWVVDTAFPGYIRIQNDIPDMPGNVVVLNQAGGNCQPPQCPVFRLLGSRVNSSIPETIGSYEVTWTSAQTKANIKEAPFVLLNSSGAEIARVSYVSESSQNFLRFRFLSDTGMYTVDFDQWLEDVPQSFKVTVNLTTLSTATSNTIALAFTPAAGGPMQSVTLANPKASNATSLVQIGYVLTDIDSGIIASDNWRIIRLADYQ